MTPEQEPMLSSTTVIKRPSTIERVTQSAGQSAHYWGLNPLASEALAKFAVITYRIGVIKEDFVGKTTERILYRIDSWANRDFTFGMTVKQNNYANMLSILSATAFNLYGTYLDKDDRTTQAAREVKRRVEDLFPKIPLATFPTEK
jgi:hypothetical protein